MNWRQRIFTDWPDNPQQSHRAKDALRQIEEALNTLASLGHPLHLEEGYSPPPPPEWPKVMFHIQQNARVVACKADLDELGEGWYETMDEARHAAGVTKQNQRGGIFKDLPLSLTVKTDAEESAAEEMERLAKEAHTRYVREQREINRAKGLWDLPEAKRNARSI